MNNYRILGRKLFSNVGNTKQKCHEEGKLNCLVKIEVNAK